MRFTRFALGAAVILLVAFMLLVAVGIHGALTPVIAVLALAGLIACGNLLYGKNSHGATAKARVRPAQEAQNRAIDEAQAQAQAQAQARQEREAARRHQEQSRRQRDVASGPGHRRRRQTQQSGDDPR